MAELDALDARSLDVELYFHTHSPAANAEMAGLLELWYVTARQAWMAAHAVHDHAGEAAAVAEWVDAARLLGVAAAGLRAQRRAIETAGMPAPPIILFTDRP